MADSMSPSSMALTLTRFVAGAVVELLSAVVAVLAASRLVGGLWIYDRLGAGASSWAGPGLESWTFAVPPRRTPGGFLPMAGGRVCSSHAYVHTV